MNQRSRRLYLIYLGILSIAGGMTVYLATAKIGPGVSTDAAMMLSTAENIVKGRGLVDYLGRQLTQFAPLYSLLLALGTLVFHQQVFTIGWALAMLVFAATIWFSGLYFYDAFREMPVLAYIASFIIFSSTSLIEISSNFASDPLFLLLVVLFLMATTGYNKSHIIRDLVVAAALTIIACFQRYAGLSLAIAGTLIVAFTGRANIRSAVVRASIFGIASALPILLWGYLHNAPLSGSAFGGRLPSVPALNFTSGVEKVLYWFIPLRVIGTMGPFLLFGIILVVLIVAVAWVGKAAAFQRLLSPEALPSLVFLVVYAAVLVFDISYYELRGVNTDRVHIILLPSLLIVVLSMVLPILQAARQRFGLRPVYAVTMLLFLAWSVYPLARTDEYIRRSRVNGDISSYNSINKGDILTSPLARYILTLDLAHKKVYSNGSDSAWFILHSQIGAMPLLGSEDRLNELKQHYGKWPGAGRQGYLIWFNSEAYKPSYATPEELATVASLQEIYRDEQGAVYSVSQR